jgi:hypothetical protein
MKIMFKLFLLLSISPTVGWAQNACVPQQAIGSRTRFSNLKQLEPMAPGAVSPGPIYSAASSSTPISGNTMTVDMNRNYNLCATPGSTQSVAVVNTSTSAVNTTNLSGVLVATKFAGNDIGAQVNAAYAALPKTGGRIFIPQGTYTWTTPVNFSTAGVCPVLEGAGRNATTLNWAGSTSATAITFNCATFSPQGGILTGYGLRDLSLFNTVAAGSTVGILLGGTNGAFGWYGLNLNTGRFNVNLLYASNTWNTVCELCNWDFAGTSNLVIPSTIDNAGEGLTFVGNTFDYSVSTAPLPACIHNSVGDLLTFLGGSFDNCQFVQDGGTGSTVLIGVNEEDPVLTSAPGATAYYGVLSSGTVRIIGGTFLQDEAVGTPPTQFWNVTGGTLAFNGVWASNVNSTTMLLAVASGTGGIMFDVPAVGGHISYPFWRNSGTGVVQGRDQLGNAITNGGIAPSLLNQSSANKYSGVSACSGGTKSITFPASYSVQPSILLFDETTKGGINLTAKSTSGFTASCAGAADTFDWLVVGDPN